MKRAANNNAGEADVPSTQPPMFSSPPPSSESGEGYYEPEDVDHRQQWGEEEGDFPEQPDLGWYFSQYEISDLAVIAVCRTFANYLSAKQPKNVEPKAGCYTKRRKVGKK